MRHRKSLEHAFANLDADTSANPSRQQQERFPQEVLSKDGPRRLMGVSHALYEEMTFDEGAVTSRDWQTYPILTMADVPEIKVVILAHPEVGTAGGGSEAANALAISAIAAAFLDATGRPARRLPLRPEYVAEWLKRT